MAKDLTKGNEGKNIIFFALPMLLGNVFQQLYNTVDSVIVGKFVGPDALSAVGISFPVLFLMVSLTMGLGMGASIVISQYFGAGKHDEVKRAVSTMLIIAAVMAVITSVLGMLFSGAILRLLNTPDEIFDMAKSYLLIIMGGLVCTFAYNGLAAILRGVGDSVTPLIFLIVSTILNIMLDLLFVLSFRMGVSGAAIATIISQGVSAVLCAVYSYRKMEIFRFDRTSFKFDKKIALEMFKIGIPSSIQQAVVSIGMLAVQRLVNGFGSDTIAAYTAASKIDSFAVMPVININAALSTFVAQNIGAGKRKRARRGLYYSFLYSAAFIAAISTVILLFAPGLIKMFIDEAEGINDTIILQGTQYLSVVAYFYILFSIMSIMTGFLRGAGDAIWVMIITIVNLVIRVAASYYLVSIPSVSYSGIWWSFPISWGSGIILSAIRYVQGGWKKKAVISIIGEEAAI